MAIMGSLPQELNVNGRDYSIVTDYRSILRVICAYADTELKDEEKAYVCLRRVYGDDFKHIPPSDYGDALEAANRFIECGERDDRPSPRVVNWEKDEQLIFPAVNRAAGMEVRALPYLHWWTFLGYFQSIDAESTWGFVLTLRQKKAKGKKLEKHEKEFWNAHRLLCAVDRPKDARGGRDRADSIFDDLMSEAQGGGLGDGE